jgi:hypothetical protein
VISRVEAQDGAAEQAVENLGPPWTDSERLGVRPWNVPERDDRRARQALAHHAGQQSEVVVLDQHDRVVGLRFLRHCVREPFVDPPVLPPVFVAENRSHMRDVTQRPQAFVRKAVVVAAFLGLGQPDPAQRVALFPGRHTKPSARIDDVTIGRSAAVRDPRAGARAHDRFDRRDETAGGALHFDPARRLHVDVRFPVRDEQDLVAAQLVVQQPAQCLGCPVHRDALVARSALALDVAQQAPQVAHQRLEFGPRL